MEKDHSQQVLPWIFVVSALGLASYGWLGHSIRTSNDTSLSRTMVIVVVLSGVLSTVSGLLMCLVRLFVTAPEVLLSHGYCELFGIGWSYLPTLIRTVLCLISLEKLLYITKDRGLNKYHVHGGMGLFAIVVGGLVVYDYSSKVLTWDAAATYCIPTNSSIRAMINTLLSILLTLTFIFVRIQLYKRRSLNPMDPYFLSTRGFYQWLAVWEVFGLCFLPQFILWLYAAFFATTAPPTVLHLLAVVGEVAAVAWVPLAIWTLHPTLSTDIYIPLSNDKANPPPTSQSDQ